MRWSSLDRSLYGPLGITYENALAEKWNEVPGIVKAMSRSEIESFKLLPGMHLVGGGKRSDFWEEWARTKQGSTLNDRWYDILYNPEMSGGWIFEARSGVEHSQSRKDVKELHEQIKAEFNRRKEQEKIMVQRTKRKPSFFEWLMSLFKSEPSMGWDLVRKPPQGSNKWESKNPYGYIITQQNDNTFKLEKRAAGKLIWSGGQYISLSEAKKAAMNHYQG